MTKQSKTAVLLWLAEIITRGRIPADAWSGSSDPCHPRTGQGPGSDPCCHERSCLAGEKGLFNKHNVHSSFVTSCFHVLYNAMLYIAVRQRRRICISDDFLRCMKCPHFYLVVMLGIEMNNGKMLYLIFTVQYFAETGK